MHRRHHRIVEAVAIIALTVYPGGARAEERDRAREEPPLVVASSPSLAPESPPAPVAPRDFEHARGFAIDGRLPVERAGSELLATLPFTEAAVALGYRGQRFALLVGPLFSRTTSDSGCGRGCSARLSRYGAQLRADLTMIRAAGGRLDAFVPLTFSLQGSTVSSDAPIPAIGAATSGEATWTATAGLGARYWLTEHVAAFSEIRLRWTDQPQFTSLPLTSPGRERIASLGGALGVAFVF